VKTIQTYSVLNLTIFFFIYPNLECVNLNIVWITDAPGLVSLDFETFLVFTDVFLNIEVCLDITV